MKKQLLFLFFTVFLLCALLFAYFYNKSKVKVLEDGLCFCESVYEYNDTMYISNFGSMLSSPVQDSISNGYILQYDGEKLDTLVGPNGKFFAPKGLARAGKYLYVADVNRLHAVDVTSKDKKIITIPLASNDIYVNHLLVLDDVLLISVSNSNHILALLLKENGAPDISGVQLFFSVPSPNGMAVADGKLFIASFNPKGEAIEENVIYVVDDFNNPNPKPFISRVGQYDGLAVKDNWLYFSDWNEGAIGKINLDNSDQIIMLNVGQKFQSPAQISFFDGYLCVPDLMKSKIFMITDW